MCQCILQFSGDVICFAFERKMEYNYSQFLNIFNFFLSFIFCHQISISLCFDEHMISQLLLVQLEWPLSIHVFTIDPSLSLAHAHTLLLLVSLSLSLPVSLSLSLTLSLSPSHSLYLSLSRTFSNFSITKF